jgi:Carboxypeptidase regulatory-like domain/TonB dependent receptor
MSYRETSVKFALVLCLLLVTSIAMPAQLTEGTIATTVADPSGAAVAKAKLQVTNLGTSALVTQTTDDIGYARFLHLEPGTYQMRVEASGFKTAVVDNIVVSVNVVSKLNVVLQIGSTTESVEVTSATPLVQTEEGRLANTLSARDVTSLPLNGREVYQLVTLEPGVTATNAPVVSNVSSPTSATTFNDGFIANGSTPRGNNFIMDGNSNNNEWLGGTPLVFPSLDAIQEVQVQTLNFSAEYGRNDGAIVNVITRSGTNSFHGDAFYSGRNTALNTRNYFDQVAKTPLHQNQFGAALGGPIIKDKTFFFLAYEGSRLTDGAPADVTTETPQFRNSVITTFPKSIAAMFYKDFPGPACLPGTAISTGSVLPASLGPLAVGPPNPNLPDQCTGFSSQLEPSQADQYMIRVDEHLTSKDQLYGRWIATTASGDVGRDELSGAAIRGFTAPQTGFFADLSLGYTHEFSNSTLNDLRFAYSRNNSNLGFGLPPNTETASVLASHGYSPERFGTIFFDDGMIPMGGEIFNPRDFVFNTFAVNDILTHMAGRHGLKFGFEIRRIQENSNYELLTNPYYEFNSKFNFANDQPYLVSATISREPGPNFGNFTDSPRNFRWTQFAAFVQDDWKVTPKLTLNLGLRYSIFGSPSETNGLLNNIILGPGPGSLTNRMPTATVGRVNQLWQTDLNNFAPRIGIAWDPLGHGTSSIRAGFAIAYQEAFSNLWSNGSRFDPPDSARVVEDPVFGVGTNLNYTFPFQSSPDFAAPSRPNGGIQNLDINLYGTDPNLRSAYAEQWFLGIQQQFLRNYGLTINYVGTHGVGNYTREDYNRYDGDICNPSVCDYTIHRLNPGWEYQYYTANEGNSIYNGLNAQLRMNYNHGFTFTANYTFGKVLDNVTEGNLGDYFNVNAYSALYTGVADISKPGLDRGPAEFDVKQRFTFAGVWNLPSPASRGLVYQILGGWQLNPIISLQSGRPFDVDCGLAWFQGCDFNMDGVQYDHPNRPANLKTAGFTNQQFVNGLFGDRAVTFYGPTFESRTSAAIARFCPNGLNSILDFGPVFSGPTAQCVPVGSDGTLGRNVFRGPSYASVDVGLLKDFPIKDTLKLQFQASAFNLFNRVNLYNPIGDMGSPQFGQSTAAFPSRQIQLGLRVLF